MTKLQVTFSLTRPLACADMDAFGRAHSVYGVHAVRLAPAADSIRVEYDASRLSEPRLESALLKAGIPLTRKPAAP